MFSAILKQKLKVQDRGFDRICTTSTGLNRISSKPAKFDDIYYLAAYVKEL